MTNRENVRRLTDLGWSAREISRELGITMRSVTRFRQLLGIQRPAAIPYTPEEDRWIRMALEDGMSFGEIARTLDRNVDYISKKYKGLSRASSMCDSVHLRMKMGLFLS